jgi:hypothetical protein
LANDIVNRPGSGFAAGDRDGGRDEVSLAVALQRQ